MEALQSRLERIDDDSIMRLINQYNELYASLMVQEGVVGSVRASLELLSLAERIRKCHALCFEEMTARKSPWLPYVALSL
jgi:hypothetical protein